MDLNELIVFERPKGSSQTLLLNQTEKDLHQFKIPKNLSQTPYSLAPEMYCNKGILIGWTFYQVLPT